MYPHVFNRHVLALALVAALASHERAQAQQVVADGDEQTPAAGDYRTTDPVTPGAPSGYAFHALNGGRILPLGPVNLFTAGRGAHGAHVEGAGSRMVLAGGAIFTSGGAASGLSIAAGGAVHATGVSIDVSGNSSHGVLLAGGDAYLEDVNIRSGANGIHVQEGQLQVRGGSIALTGSGQALRVEAGIATLENTLIDMGSQGGYGVLATGTGSVAVRGARIQRDGYGGTAATAHGGATLDLHDVEIRMQGGSNIGVALGGAVDIRNSHIAIEGLHGRAVDMGAGALAIQDSTLSADLGIRTFDNGKIDIARSEIHANYFALDINGDNNQVQVEATRLTSRDGTAIWMPGRSTLTLRDAVVEVGGARGLALDVRAGHARVEGSTLRTTGESAHGLYAQDDRSNHPLIEAFGSHVHTLGDGSVAAIARTGGSVRAVDSTLLTSGRNAHGVIAGGHGELALVNTHVRTEGEGAWAAVINDAGRMTIDGGSLVSAQHGGVWLRSSRDPGLTLGNGAVVHGGNGIGLALDAAVAGRFDVELDGGAQLLGDIVTTPEDAEAGLVPQSQVHVDLSGGTHWWGSTSLVQAVALEDNSRWTLRGDAQVQQLAVHNSTVALSDDLGAGVNTLTVGGDLHSENAMFVFRGELADDASRIDRLHVRGDTSGDASIRVENIGGIGAPTDNGIPLVQVDGTSLAQYTLAGRAVGGSFEYFLFQGGIADPGDGHWYLRSQWFDRCVEDPAYLGCVVGPDPEEGGGGDPITPPHPVLRPEPGAYLANQTAAVGMFQHRLQDRAGSVGASEGRNAWARVASQHADFQAVGKQLSVDGTTRVLQVGSDVWAGKRANVGLMLGSGRADSRVVSALTGYSAKGRVHGRAIGAYATWLQQPGQNEGAYVDASLQYGRFDNRVDGVGLQRERYDSRMAAASLEAGYTFGVWQGSASNVYVQPQLQVTHVAFRAQGHHEHNGTRVDNADAGGVQGRLGVRLFGHGHHDGNVVQPYMAVNWLRGAADNTLDFNGTALGAQMPRNRHELQAGAELTLGSRWAAWGGMTVQRGDRDYRDVGGQLGMRLRW